SAPQAPGEEGDAYTWKRFIHALEVAHILDPPPIEGSHEEAHPPEKIKWGEIIQEGVLAVFQGGVGVFELAAAPETLGLSTVLAEGNLISAGLHAKAIYRDVTGHHEAAEATRDKADWFGNPFGKAAGVGATVYSSWSGDSDNDAVNTGKIVENAVQIGIS